MLVLVCLCGCAELGTIQLVDEKTVVPQRKAVIFFVDGVDHKVFEDMLKGGKLPQIDKYLIKRGCLVEAAVTAVPSITYAITATFATGLVPGHHGILGNKFFDRDRLSYINYNTIDTYRDIDNDYAAPNFYEILGDQFSITIQTPLTRGAYHRITNWAESGTCWFLGRFETVDRWTARRFRMVSEIARKCRRWPALIYAYFPATDEIGHRWGTDSTRYHEGLENIDRQVGHICGSLKKSGLLDSTYLVFISDHGMANSEPENSLNIRKLLEENSSLRIAEQGPNQRKSFIQRGRYFRKYNAVLCNGAGRRVVLYLKNGTEWSRLPTTEQIRTIAEPLVRQPGVCLTAYRHPKGVIVHSGVGQALIERRENKACPLDEKQYRYRIIDGTDPLCYDGSAETGGLIDGNYHNGRVWLESTARTAYPDLPVQIVELFDSRRSGDLFIFAADNWDFDPGIVGGHGSVRQVDMRMPMIFAGPEIKPASRLETARTVDVAPTLIDMLAPERLKLHNFDGRSLLPAMKREPK
jgi:arylsulfatase A-like enzyme